MHEFRASRTAFRVAVRRAAHQVLDRPKVFDDPLALRIVGEEAAARIASEGFPGEGLAARARRAFFAARSRYAEDELARSVENGIHQYVVLGAGLDTFAYRNPFASQGLRVFEVDHPATQAWKRELLEAASIGIPAGMAFVAVDFERQTLADQLRLAGFRADKPAFFSWLGVVPYLTDTAFQQTVSFVAAMPAETGIVFDYAVDPAALTPAERAALDALARRVSAAGEPFQLFFQPDDLHRRLARAGFRHIEDLGRDQINARYFASREDRMCVRGSHGHLLCARV
ncbi:MAG: class I SAM-dependent methyltransferase [Bryobacteraceae bacterium]